MKFSAITTICFCLSSFDIKSPELIQIINVKAFKSAMVNLCTVQCWNFFQVSNDSSEVQKTFQPSLDFDYSSEPFKLYYEMLRIPKDLNPALFYYSTLQVEQMRAVQAFNKEVDR